MLADYWRDEYKVSMTVYISWSWITLKGSRDVYEWSRLGKTAISGGDLLDILPQQKGRPKLEHHQSM